ncbi:DNA polymerase III subunit delta [Pseudogracilibacillus sp. SO30301A]|uniref:DNA polymerase III subunit delta n=1 Tax=Pseudogracilibacillus sp. SO30301A TaxID=3098291 RepID=UPI00300E69C8
MSSLNKTLQEIKKGKISPIYVLCGTERYFIEQFKTTLIRKIASEISDDITTYDLKETSIQEVLTDVETLPFFNEKKIIIATDPVFLKTKADSLPFTHDVQKMEEYVENPVPYSILVLIAPYEKIDARKKVTKMLKKQTEFIDCNPIKENELRKWINYMAQNHQLTMTEDALYLLESEFENNLYLLQQEMEKLSLYVGEKGEVTQEIAKEIISASLSFSAFELIDAVLKKDLYAAIKIYKDLERKGENPIGLIAFLAYQFRIIYQVKLLKQKGHSYQQIPKTINVHPYVVQLASKRSSSFNNERLSEIINELTNTDAAIKRGKMDKGMAFEMLLYKIIAY